MQRGRCFLCKRQDSQALRRQGVRFFYMIAYTRTGAHRRQYFCSDCENTRTPEIEAAYRRSEANERARRAHLNPELEIEL